MLSPGCVLGVLGRALLAGFFFFGLVGVAPATRIATLDNGSCTVSGSGVEYRNHDGSCNNLMPGLGALGRADTVLLRMTLPDYADDMAVPRQSAAGGDLPSTRDVSNAVVAQSGSIFNANGVSGMLMQWGQFLDHDIDLTHVNHGEPMDIPVSVDDIHFSGAIPFSRSQYDDTTGSGGIPRQQINAITAYIDASQIYGSDSETAWSLRTGQGGKLRMTGDMLHRVDSTDDGIDNPTFVSGDERAREQVGLTAMHTLFNREHNRLAAEIEAGLEGTVIDGVAPGTVGYDEILDEKVYQEVRKLVGGMMQAITFNEFLPALLGGGAPGAYIGYDPTVNPGIANEFSTAAYRFGHSTLSAELWRLDANGAPIADGHLPLEMAFFRPEQLLTPELGGIEAILRGLIAQPAQEVDTFLVDAVRNMLFPPPVDVGFDLAALNMQRGRDHGLPGYTAMRRALFGTESGFVDVTGWDDLDGLLLAGAVDLLRAVYEDVDDIDLWVGGLAEKHVNGGLLGELFAAIVGDQFERLRDGDRFWYLNGMFEPEWIDFIEQSTLGAIIMRNTGITGLQADVFFVPAPGVPALLALGLLLLRRRTGSRS